MRDDDDGDDDDSRVLTACSSARTVCDVRTSGIVRVASETVAPRTDVTTSGGGGVGGDNDDDEDGSGGYEDNGQS